PGRQDSITYDKTTTLLRKMDSTRLADSIRRVELLNEIENLRGSEANRQREILLQRLRDEEVEDSVRKAHQLEELGRLKLEAKGYPVTFFSDTLFLVYTRVG